MIDPKYANLPGIAYDQPDVYETDDVPENNANQNYLQEDGDSVEKIYISASDAFTKFKDKRIHAKDINFSDVMSSKLKGYDSLSTLELETLMYKQNESPTEKFERIKTEIKEFMEQMNTIKESQNFKDTEDGKSLIDIIHQIELLGKELDAINIETVLNLNSTTLSQNQEVRFKELMSQIEIFKRKTSLDNSFPAKDINLAAQEAAKQGLLKYQMIYVPEKAKIEDMARLSYLEKRVGHLENLIGISGNSNTKYSHLLRSQGISQSVEKLMANACLLNSTQLDILENKVTSLLNKMDGVVQKQVTSGYESKYEKMISELYETVKQSENYSQILPQIIDRMISLSHLHQKAAEFSSQLKELENLRQNVNGALLNNKTVLEEIQGNFSKNLEIIANDITALTERIKKLKK